MASEDLILIEKLCEHYAVEITFINALGEVGLIEIETIEDCQFIHQDKISDLEKMIRIHQDLAVNIEGIDVVFNLLQKVDSLQEELMMIKNRLRRYEDDF